MGAKKIAVVDLSESENQPAGRQGAVKTSRKRTSAVMVKEKKPTKTKTMKNEEVLEESGVPIEEQELAQETADEIIAEEKEAAKKETLKMKPSQKTAKKTHSKRYSEIAAKVDPNKIYPIDQAISLAKETGQTKFVGSVQAHLAVSQKGLRGFITLPHYSGKKKTTLVFGNVKTADGIIAGDDKTIEDISVGKLVAGKDFESVISTPTFMPKLARVARILGPKGMMPNPKSGTVTENPEEVIKEFSSGKMEYKTENTAPIIHLTIGKVNTEETKLKENLQTVISTIGANKISRITINATMGPGIKVQIV